MLVVLVKVRKVWEIIMQREEEKVPTNMMNQDSGQVCQCDDNFRVVAENNGDGKTCDILRIKMYLVTVK